MIYINRVAFLVAIDKQIRYRSIIHVKDQDTSEFFKCLDQILRLYNSAGFTITTIHADNEFKPLMERVKDDLNVDMNYANPGDTISEGSIKTILASQVIRIKKTLLLNI